MTQIDPKPLKIHNNAILELLPSMGLKKGKKVKIPRKNLKVHLFSRFSVVCPGPAKYGPNVPHMGHLGYFSEKKEICSILVDHSG